VPSHLLPPTDEDLVRRCLQHDEDAWQDLLDRYAGYVYAIAVRGFRLTPPEAEEVLQETALAMVQHLRDFRGSGALRAWIGAIAQNACRQYLRRQRPSAEVPGDVEAADTSQEEVLAQAEEALAVQAALERLPRECQEVLRQAFFAGRRYAEIASALGIPEGTVASRVARCLTRLRGLLEESP
jgi:RNA polymerase sigma-70 factor (ECF subfamily)